MYLPVLLQTRCLAIVFCSLITIGNQANADTPSTPPSQQQQQQQFHQNAQNQPYSTYKPTQNSNPSSKLPTQQQQQHQQQQQQQSQQQQHHGNSYTMLSQAMSQAVSHEFSGSGTSADGTCLADDIECNESHDRLGMEAIRSLHQQLDDDENGNIDLSESDDFLREELKYDSGYEKRHKTFHYNDDTQISVKELWEAWLRSEVHNWTVEQTADWLAESVQLPQYVEIFQKHKVNGQTLPRLAVHNMHYVSNVLGIRDPIHKQKIALKAMDVVLFGPPRETGTRWKDYILVTLLLSAIIGCWYAYQQNKSAKRHLRRMAKDMEGLQKAEIALTEMQKELEQARLEQENVATEKLDLERRLKEAPSLSSSSSDLEVQQLKQEIEMLRSELSRAEVELVDHCWTPPPALQSWLQLTYELESKHTLKKRIMAEKQLQVARDACEKLKRKRSSLVGAFVSTHGKSIDDVDRSIVEARNALSEVTNELQERLHRWKQIEMLLGFSIVNNNGIAYLENVLYNRNGSGKSLRSRISGSQDELDDESVQGYIDNHGRYARDDSSASDDGGDSQSTVFIIGSGEYLNQIPPATSTSPPTPAVTAAAGTAAASTSVVTVTSMPLASNTSSNNHNNNLASSQINSNIILTSNSPHLTSAQSVSALSSSQNSVDSNLTMLKDEYRQSTYSLSPDKVAPLPRNKKTPAYIPSGGTTATNRTTVPMPPPRRANSQQSVAFNTFLRSQGADMEPMESTSSIALQSNQIQNYDNSSISSSSNQQKFIESQQQQQQQQLVDDNSTDSSSFDDDSARKKHRRKLHFPFGKKTFQKNKHI